MVQLPVKWGQKKTRLQDKGDGFQGPDDATIENVEQEVLRAQASADLKEAVKIAEQLARKEERRARRKAGEVADASAAPPPLASPVLDEVDELATKEPQRAERRERKLAEEVNNTPSSVFKRRYGPGTGAKLPRPSTLTSRNSRPQFPSDTRGKQEEDSLFFDGN
jgi:hypothetical protein